MEGGEGSEIWCCKILKHSAVILPAVAMVVNKGLDDKEKEEEEEEKKW